MPLLVIRTRQCPLSPLACVSPPTISDQGQCALLSRPRVLTPESDWFVSDFSRAPLTVTSWRLESASVARPSGLRTCSITTWEVTSSEHKHGGVKGYSKKEPEEQRKPNNSLSFLFLCQAGESFPAVLVCVKFVCIFNQPQNIVLRLSSKIIRQ